MIRVTGADLTRPSYAFQPATFRLDDGWPTVDAIWHEYLHGLHVVAIGLYHPFVRDIDAEPADGRYESWIAADDDGSHLGVELIASWDGQDLYRHDWLADLGGSYDMVELLAAATRRFPAVPDGWDGWWTAPKPGKE